MRRGIHRRDLGLPRWARGRRDQLIRRAHRGADSRLSGRQQSHLVYSARGRRETCSTGGARVARGAVRDTGPGVRGHVQARGAHGAGLRRVSAPVRESRRSYRDGVESRRLPSAGPGPTIQTRRRPSAEPPALVRRGLDPVAARDRRASTRTSTRADERCRRTSGTTVRTPAPTYPSPSSSPSRAFENRSLEPGTTTGWTSANAPRACCWTRAGAGFRAT